MNILFDVARFTAIQIIFFGSFFLGIYYFTLYDDGTSLNNAIKDIQKNVDQVEGQISTKQKELENVKNFEKEILAEEEVIKHFLNFVPASLTFTDVTTLLINEAKSAGVNIELKQDKMIDKKENSEYSTLEIQLKVSGTFSQIMLFLSKLTSQKRMLIVKNINMRVEAQNRLITADLIVIAYRYEEPEQQALEENITE